MKGREAVPAAGVVSGQRSESAPAPGRLNALKLRVSPAAERSLRSGHPWVFEASVRECNRDGVSGETAVVYDARDRFLAIGLFDPHSAIRFRALHIGQPTPIDEAWWERHLEAALARRAVLLADPTTTGCRVIHGEGDGWSGLVADRYGSTLVIKVYSAVWLSRVRWLAAALARRLAAERVVLRLSRNLQSNQSGAGADEFVDGVVVLGTGEAGAVRFRESGLWFEADVLRGQKTGFFLDQRDNRRRVGEMTAGARVLNVFSFNGGFSLYAARGGARSVTDVDISEHALAGAARNRMLNREVPGVAACVFESVQADAFAWLERGGSGQEYDVVIVDPPSLARREAERAGAIAAYRRLAQTAAGCVRGGGRLVAASCSAHVTRKEFRAAVLDGLRACRRRFTLELETGHPEDHPATIPEAEYLKCLYLRLDD